MLKLNKTNAQAILNRMVNNWFIVDGQRQKVDTARIAPTTNRVMIMSSLATNFETLENLPKLLLRYQAVDTDLADFIRASLGIKTKNNPYHPEIAARIRQIRLRRGIKQAAVASALGCSQQNYNQMECVIKSPRVSTLLQICQALDVELWYLLSPMPVTDESLHSHKRLFAPGPDNYNLTITDMVKIKQALHGVEAVGQ